MEKIQNPSFTHLSAINLSKKYGSFLALAPISFELKAGDITVLSGPNGSGKTTLLCCLSGLIRPTTGSVTVNGFDLYRDEIEVRRRMIFVPDVPRFYSELTAWEHLYFIAKANEVEQNIDRKAEDLLHKFGLWEAKDLFPHHYSRGMQLKLGLAMAFIRPFDVILLDEPTSALDAEGVDILLDELRFLQQQGKSVLISSHDKNIIQRLGNQRLNIQKGVVEVG
ncbi:MAG: hypothetical protein CVU46_02575 [Chloroflexi bacterium HGW-Chloroflexi-8]|nr:MAG: hypothetical protein CVU46_02575 [Chloroflexi bacterium HGW-Chloroflexi-8]